MPARPFSVEPGQAPVLDVGTRSSGSRTVVSPVGEIELTTASTLYRSLYRVLSSPRREVWIDLTRVTFMDVAGLHVILAVQRALERDHRRLGVVVADGIVRRLIEVADADLAVLHDRRRTSRDA